MSRLTFADSGRHADGKSVRLELEPVTAGSIGALIIRIGFWGPFYHDYNKEPPQNSIGNY